MFFKDNELQELRSDLREEIFDCIAEVDSAVQVVAKLDSIAKELGYERGYMELVTRLSTSSQKLESLLEQAKVETPYQSSKEDIEEVINTIKGINALFTDTKLSMGENLPTEVFDNEDLRQYVLS